MASVPRARPVTAGRPGSEHVPVQGERTASVRSTGAPVILRERGDDISTLDGLNAKRFATTARNPRGIQNRLHAILVLGLAEDPCRVRKCHTAENFNRLRRIALKPLQREISNLSLHLTPVRSAVKCAVLSVESTSPSASLSPKARCRLTSGRP